MTHPLVEAYRAALRAIERGTPKSLLKRAAMEADDVEPSPDVSESALRDYVKNADPNDELIVNLHLALAWWDNALQDLSPWARDTPANTNARRKLVISALGLDQS